MQYTAIVCGLFMLSACTASIETTHQPTTIAGPEKTAAGGNSSKLLTILTYKKYCNARYDFCVDYPVGLLYPQPEPQNGGGRVFKNKRGAEVLTVFGTSNDGEEGPLSLEEKYNEDLQGPVEEENDSRVITYHKLGDDFYVISGYNRGKIFYQKTIVKEDAFATAVLVYNESEKRMYNEVSARIFKSFK